MLSFISYMMFVIYIFLYNLIKISLLICIFYFQMILQAPPRGLATCVCVLGAPQPPHPPHIHTHICWHRGAQRKKNKLHSLTLAAAQCRFVEAVNLLIEQPELHFLKLNLQRLVKVKFKVQNLFYNNKKICKK